MVTQSLPVGCPFCRAEAAVRARRKRCGSRDGGRELRKHRARFPPRAAQGGGWAGEPTAQQKAAKQEPSEAQGSGDKRENPCSARKSRETGRWLAEGRGTAKAGKSGAAARSGQHSAGAQALGSLWDRGVRASKTPQSHAVDTDLARPCPCGAGLAAPRGRCQAAAAVPEPGAREPASGPRRFVLRTRSSRAAALGPRRREELRRRV